MDTKGENLIFLISQPRAGSTLLQRILGSHPTIHTLSEPWLMLHPLYALRPSGYHAEYGEHLARTGVQSFLQTLPGQDGEYTEGVRRMYSYLYQVALAGSGRRYFLDKTPRYYFIIPELHRTFPEARYIFVWRNPLAVLCSILNTHTRGNWLSLHNRRHDLIRAPHLLIKGIETVGADCMVVHYEQLVRRPEGVFRGICKRLGVDFVPDMIEYGRQPLPRWGLGDQEEVYRHTRPVSQNADKWVEALDDPHVWRLANDYLRVLGWETVEQMGYPYDQLRQILEAHRPRRSRLWLTFSLSWLLKEPARERKWWVHGIVRFERALRQRGPAVARYDAQRRPLA